ncbi:pentapeptide repeat-containing protein [Nocardia sp. BMG51109]|uniref:pentapeptide repeat-containing protein n=1 Tax=Nocardia sp. BMG51109 TaxID=1056816 RepID=UPI0004659409|nr:pentapeptide repeat-containing protein [Nocardia sp. BMG51109]
MWPKRIQWRDRNGNDRQDYSPAPFAITYTGMLALGLLGSFVAYLLLHQLDHTAARLDVIKTALAVVAGSGAGAALYVSYRKQRTDEANSLREQDRLFTERYTKAVEQLGHSAPAIRLGGVTALVRIADDSARDRPTCLSLLCTYLRLAAGDEAVVPGERHVRDTIVRELANRLRPDHPGFWHHAVIDLSGARLDDPADFSGCTIDRCVCIGTMFGDDVSFREATFEGNASFRKAVFEGNASFRNATFKSMALFAQATFERRATFEDVEWTGERNVRTATFAQGSPFPDQLASP